VALDSVTPRNGQADVTLAGEFGGGGCGVVFGCEPGPGPSAGASVAGTGFVVVGAGEAVVGAGAGVEHAVSNASAAAVARIPPRFPIPAE
jgi:hypothetical protein